MTADARKSMLIVLAGPPCSGKSTIGAWLAKILPGVHLEIDALVTLLLPDSDRCLEDRLAGYEFAVAGSKAILRRGLNLILDCTYSRRQERQQLIDNLPPGVRLIVVEFAVTPAAAVNRFAQRPEHHATDLTPEIVRTRAESYPYGYGTALVNSESSLEVIQRSVLDAIEAERDFDRGEWVQRGL